MVFDFDKDDEESRFLLESTKLTNQLSTCCSSSSSVSSSSYVHTSPFDPCDDGQTYSRRGNLKDRNCGSSSISSANRHHHVNLGDENISLFSYKLKVGVLLSICVVSLIAVLNYHSGKGLGVLHDNNNMNKGDESISSSSSSFTTNSVTKAMKLSAAGPWRTEKKYYIPTKCPGITIMSGSTDPRNIDLTKADMSGLGPHGLETSVNAKVYRTGQVNKHDVHWLVADTSEGDDYKLIKMVMIKVEAVNNEIQLCTIAAGDFDVYNTDIELDEMTAKQAWASRTTSLISECDTCPGYGVMNVEADWTSVDYDADSNLYQSVGFLSQSCPGDNFGHSDTIQNVTTDLIDGYAGLAFLSGNDVRKGDGHEAVIFPNAEGTYDNVISYIVGYVDFQDWTMKMVEVQLSDLDGQVHLCAPRAKTYANAPDLVNKSNIDFFWDNAEGINVAACASCAGYGVSSFKFETSELIMPTPIPTASPLSVPTVAPSNAPRASPTAEPTELPEGAYIVPDGKGTEQEILEEVVDGTPDGHDTRRFYPVAEPTRTPIVEPSFAPIPGPTFHPIEQPTFEPTHDRILHTMPPTIIIPTMEPTREPSAEPTKTPVVPPTFYPVGVPTTEPITEPTPAPTLEPTEHSNLILGRPCEKDDDYVDQGGLTVNGTSITENPEDADIGTTEYLTMDPSPAPTMEPTHAPTEHLDPGETAEPTLSPTFQPTYPSVAPTIEPTTEPTMGPVETLDEPGETYHPTLAPTIVPTEASAAPTAPPTARATFGDTLEPCVWEGDIYAPDSSLSDNQDTDAIPDASNNRKLMQTVGMKSCTDHYGANFKKTLKLVKKHAVEVERLGDPISASAVMNVKTQTRQQKATVRMVDKSTIKAPSKTKPVKTALKAQRSVNDMSTAERRAFYLSHFTPEAKAKIAKRKQAATVAKHH